MVRQVDGPFVAPAARFLIEAHKRGSALRDPSCCSHRALPVRAGLSGHGGVGAPCPVDGATLVADVSGRLLDGVRPLVLVLS